MLDLMARKTNCLNLASAGLLGIVTLSSTNCVPNGIADLGFIPPSELKQRKILAGEWERDDGAFLKFYTDNGLIGEVTIGDLECFGVEGINYTFCDNQYLEIDDANYGKGNLSDIQNTNLSRDKFHTTVTRNFNQGLHGNEQRAHFEGKIINEDTLQVIANFSQGNFYGASFGSGTSEFKKVR